MSEVKLLAEKELKSIRDQLISYSNGQGTTMLSISSSWTSELLWARNAPSMTSDRRNVSIFVMRNIKRGLGVAHINQTESLSLRGAMLRAEEFAINGGDPREPDDHAFPIPVVGLEGTATTWSKDTFNRAIEESSRLVHAATIKAKKGGLMSSGYLENRALNILRYFRDEFGRENPDMSGYGELTQIQCSVTVRDPKGIGSGWAGRSSYAIADVDELAISERALEKAVKSINPVRVEPGRYTVVLEPQATSDLLDHLVLNTIAVGRGYAESSQGHPMWLATDETLPRQRSKMGAKIVDSRVTISHSVKDPELGVIPVAGVRDIILIKKGVLKELFTDRELVLNEQNLNKPNIERKSYRMEGGSSTTEEMIASTKRGFLVSRFFGMALMDQVSLLVSGMTRDGLWLIEDGKIVKPVRNFRFLESPLYALNNIDDIGHAERIFRPLPLPQVIGFAPHMLLSQVIVPSIKVRDFSFTSIVDAI